MISFKKPKPSVIRQYLTELNQRTNYDHVEATAGELPQNGFVIDHDKTVLGEGRLLFQEASKAVARWQMYPTKMLELFRVSESKTVEVDEVCASLYRYGPWWFVNPCRVVYVENTEHTFAFAYGSVADRVECGEERFEVRFDPNTEKVTYEILVFSRPRHWLTKLGYPLVRQEQKRFRVESAKALVSYLREHSAQDDVSSK